jgi:hypothetical protein
VYIGRPSFICGESEPWPVRIPRQDVGDTVGPDTDDLLTIVGEIMAPRSGRCSSKSLAVQDNTNLCR